MAFRICLMVCLLGLACGRPQASSESAWIPSPAPDLGPTVATVGATPIFAKQVAAEAKRRGKTPREALGQLIGDAAAAEAAHKRGARLPTADDAEVESALVERFLERDLEPGLRREAIPDSALRPVYEAAREAFVHPRLVDIGVLAVYTGARMGEEARTERGRTADELAAYLANHPAASLDAFAAVAADKRWASRDVVYTRFLQGLDKPLAEVIGKEVAKLKAPGETTPLLSDSTGFYIIRYAGEKPPEKVSFDEARPRLVEVYFERWRRNQFLAFTNALLAAHKVEVHFDRISAESR